MKKIRKINYSYISIIGLAIALYIGFDKLIFNVQSETARETLNAAISVVFVIITTMYMLTKQTQIEQEKELKTAIFRKKLDLYENSLQTWQKVCFVDAEIEKEQFGQCVEKLLRLGMIAPTDVLEHGTEIFNKINNVYMDDEKKSMKGEQTEIFSDICKFIEATRADLDLPNSFLPENLKRSFNENVVKVGSSVAKNFDKFSFNGKEFGKGRLVLELVKHVVRTDKVENLDSLRMTFPSSYWSKGIEAKGKNAFVVELEEIASQRKARYFNKDDDKILLGNGSVVVVNSQWAEDNLSFLLSKLPESLRNKVKRREKV